MVLVATDVHNKFHSLLDLTLKFQKLTGRSGGYKVYGNADPATLDEIKIALDFSAVIFDDVCGAYTKPYSMTRDLNKTWKQLDY